MTSKRKQVLTWDDYYMAIAILSGQRSKDPSTQVGACIASPGNKMVGAGYNGLPWGCSDDIFPWASEGDFLKTKNAFVCHAELNAVLNAITPLTGCRMYVILFPCNECAKVIIQAGITEVIFKSMQGYHGEKATASRIMFDAAGVHYRRFKPVTDVINISLEIEDYDPRAAA